MDIRSLSGTSLLMGGNQAQQSLSASMMKQAAEQQNKIANLLAQSARQSEQTASSSGGIVSFSTYA